MTTRERFDTKWTENATTGCHEWQTSTDDDGYGRFYWSGSTGPAHRYVWEAEEGAIPDGLNVRHVVCSNPGCVNVDHLEIGTQQDNMDDRERDGNTAKGSRNGRAKLTEADIPVIRRLLRDGESQRSIARQYGVHRTTIRDIKNGSNWSHVE